MVKSKSQKKNQKRKRKRKEMTNGDVIEPVAGSFDNDPILKAWDEAFRKLMNENKNRVDIYK